MSDEAAIELEHTLSSQFESLDKASKQLAAVLSERDDLHEIVRLTLAGHETELLRRERSRIVAFICEALRPGLTVENTAQVVVDTLRKCVAESTENIATPDSDPKREGTPVADSPQRPDIAALLNLPALKDAVRVVEEHQKIYSDQAKRLPEKKVVDERGGFSLEIPRHQL
jgi:hypothetical protein